MSVGNFLYVRPDEMWSLNGAVAATVDADYQASWLTDGRSGRPVRGTSTSFSATITNPAGTVDIIALCNHNVSVSTAITGSASGTILAGGLTENGIRLNSYVQVGAVSATTLTATISSNAATVIVGDLIAGHARTLYPGPALKDQQRADDDYTFQDDSEFSSLYRYDRGVERRAFSFTQYYSSSQFDDLQSWQRSQRGGSRPSLIIPNVSLKDAWVAHLSPLTYKKQAPETYAVTLQFVEYPRSRW